MITQEQKVLNYLQNNKVLTSLVAIRELGIMQLPCRIFRLKKQYRIHKEMRKVQTRDGYSRVAYYTLAGKL